LSYTEKLKGVWTVKEHAPWSYQGKAADFGYPAMTATIVNVPEPVVSYANWFSYVTAGFFSENREIHRLIRITRALFPERKLRFVADAGLDDQTVFTNRPSRG
jgi:hypothetical protein